MCGKKVAVLSKKRYMVILSKTHCIRSYIRGGCLKIQLLFIRKCKEAVSQCGGKEKGPNIVCKGRYLTIYCSLFWITACMRQPRFEFELTDQESSIHNTYIS